MGREAFTAIPNGIPSVQERVDLVHTHGVDAGRIDLQTMVDACSTQAAKIFGLYPRKGVVGVGSDADLVIYDPSFEGTFDVADSLSKTDYSGYQGMRRKGRADRVILRGRTVVQGGRFVGDAGGGRYLERTPGH